MHIHLPGCNSLKEKRSRIKPLLARLHREFNVSAAEMDYLDSWKDSLIACALISNNHAQAQRSLQAVVEWVETSWPDVDVIEENLEIL
jgi:uncharacterized protein YlxP (DUF503 family)